MSLSPNRVLSLLTSAALAAVGTAQSIPSDPALHNAAPTVDASPVLPSSDSHRYIVRLANAPIPEKTFDERHAGLSPEASAALRRTEILAQESDYFAAYQRVADAIGVVGGQVVQHYTLLHMLAVDLSETAAAELAKVPGIALVSPAMVLRQQTLHREMSDPEVNQRHHHAASIAHQLGFTGSNRVALLAVLDSWLRGTFAGVPDYHRTLKDGGVATNATRVLLDVNPIGTFPGPALAGLDHGLGMAATAAGAGTSLPATFPLANGQAPGAGLVGVNITRQFGVTPYTCGTQNLQDPAGYYSVETDMLAGLQALATLNPVTTASGPRPVRVANLSFGGPTNPDSPLSLAIDSLAVNAGILVVMAAGNNPVPYEAFNACNGIAVGATQRTPVATHPVAAFSAQGPLRFANTAVPCAIGFGYWNFPATQGTWRMPSDAYRREYPDIAAVGTGNLQAVQNNESVAVTADGTSISAAEVSGALTLLLNGRDGGTPSVTSILEAKAMLLSTAQNNTATGNGDNQRGAGFLRTDRLTNDPMADSTTTTATVLVTNTAGVRATISTFTALPGQRFSTAIAWFRRNLNPGLVGGQPVWADVDLRITGSVSGQILDQRSRAVAGDTFGNRTWERGEYTSTVAQTISVIAVVNRAEPGTGLLQIGVATTRLGPNTPAPAANIAVLTSQSNCTVTQPIAGLTTTSVPATVAFMPVNLMSHAEVALPLAGEFLTSSSDVIDITVAGNFARSLSVPCALFNSTSGGLATTSPGCALVPGGNSYRIPNAAIANATLAIDSTTGLARATFVGVPRSSDPHYLVFTATPDMAIFMQRSTATGSPCGLVPATRLPSSSSWTLLRATYPNSLGAGACALWNCGSVYYDMRVTNGVISAGSFQQAPGIPTLSAVGNAIPGTSYGAVVRGADRTALGNLAVLIFDLANTTGAVCGSIYNPSTSILGPAVVFGTLGSSVSIDTAVPLSASLLGGVYFHQGFVLSDLGSGTPLVITPTAQVLRVAVGW